MTPQCIFSEKLITSDYVKAFLMQLITLYPIFLKVAFKQNLVDPICLKPLKNKEMFKVNNTIEFHASSTVRAPKLC